MSYHPTLDVFFAAINPVRIHSSDCEWSGNCPAHEDTRRSFSVGIGRNGQIVFHCHVNCSQEAILQSLGLTWADVASPDKAYRSAGSRSSHRHESFRRPEKPKKTPEQIELLLLETLQQTTPEQHRLGLSRWAKHLGLSYQSSLALEEVWQPDRTALLVNGGVKWCPDMKSSGLLLTPMVDGNLNKIGTAIRDWRGGKWRVEDGREGLFVPADVLDRPGPVFLVEGPTDTRALWDLGLSAIGRPNNTGGTKHLAVLLAAVPHNRPIIVIGENDQKSNGNWPGRIGAEKTARELSELLQRPVKAALVPQPFKDSREWFLAPHADTENLADSYQRSLTIFASFPLMPAEVTDEELAAAAAATLPFDSRNAYTHPEETCQRPGHLLLRSLTSGNLRHTLNRCGNSTCPQCFSRKKRLRYESLCRHYDALKLRGGQLHMATRTFSKKEWDSLRRSLIRRGGQFIRIRLPDDLFVLIATIPFPGSEVLPFDQAKEFTKSTLDQAVVEGRGKPFFTSSKEWAMAREKSERKYEKLGTVKLPPQSVKRICRQYRVDYQQKRPPDGPLLLYGEMGAIADKVKEAEFIEALLTKKGVSESHTLPMHDSDNFPPAEYGIRRLPPDWDEWFAGWLNPTA